MKNLVLFIVFLSVLTSCTKKQKNESLILRQAQGSALGTSYSILYFTSKEITSIDKSLDSLFVVVNQSMSTYIPISDISKINQGDTSVVVGHMFKDVFKDSEVIFKKTEGFFDPTVGSLVNAWGFGPQKYKLEMSAKTVDSLMQYVGFNKVKLSDNGVLQKENPNVYLDFNAIAKGYCIDRIGVYLKNKGVENYLIELGGELLSSGMHVTKNKPWNVGIDDPTQKEERTLYTTIPLKDRAMATSGNYRKFRVDSVSGKKYVHIIDAKTGYTKPSNILSVSVCAATCSIADGYATAFMAMPLKATKILVENDSLLDVYIIYSNEKGGLETYSTNGFKQSD